MSGNGPRRLPSPVRPLLSLLGFDSEAERGAFVAELRRKVVPRSLSLATLGAASVMVTEMAHPGTIPLLLPRPSCLGDWQDDSHRRERRHVIRMVGIYDHDTIPG